MYVHINTMMYFKRTYLNLVHLRNMRGADQHGIAGILELHLYADLCISNHQFCSRMSLLDLQQPLEARRPIYQKATSLHRACFGSKSQQMDERVPSHMNVNVLH
jgi:hypothetical protein